MQNGNQSLHESPIISNGGFNETNESPSEADPSGRLSLRYQEEGKEAGLIGDPIQIVFDFRTDLEELSLTPA